MQTHKMLGGISFRAAGMWGYVAQVLFAGLLFMTGIMSSPEPQSWREINAALQMEPVSTSFM